MTQVLGPTERLAILEAKVEALYKGLVIGPDGKIQANQQFEALIRQHMERAG